MTRIARVVVREPTSSQNPVRDPRPWRVRAGQPIKPSTARTLVTNDLGSV